MTREIKFRSFFNGKMIYPDTTNKYSNASFSSHRELAPSDKDKAKMIIMQFTGLKDKNGKEIYETDIIQNENGDRAIIDYRTFSASFEPRSYYGGGIHWSRQINEVVGNYHENPELL